MVVQNDSGNWASRTTIVVPTTTKNKKNLPTHVATRPKDKMEQSIILTEQPVTIDKFKLTEFVCNLSEETMAEVDEALKVSLGL